MDVCTAPYKKARNATICISPLKFFDYLSCGKPVVVSDIPEMGDIVRESQVGITVEPDNHTRLAEAITELLSNRDLGRRLGLNGRQIILKKYNWQKIAEKTIRVIYQSHDKI